MQYRVLPRQVGAKPENGICISLQIEGFAEHGCIAGIKTPEPIRTTTMSCGSPTLNKPSKPIFGLFL
jgi:hypothetical protein